MTPTDQAAQVAQAALQAPINNLVVLLALIALLIMALGGVMVWKFAPQFINLYTQQAETNKKLTQIVGQNTEQARQNAEQARLAMLSVDNNTTEMRKQTSAIVAQTGIIEGQGRDLRAYQTLVSDNLSAHTNQVAALETKVEANTESITALTEQIQALVAKLDDKAACADAEERMRKFRDEIVELVTKQQTDKRATDESNLIDATTPPAEPLEGAA